MRRGLVLLLLLGCGGPLSKVRLESVAESQRRTVLTLTFPALARTDGVVGAWEGAQPGGATVRELLFGLYDIAPSAASQVAVDRPLALAVARVDVPGPQGPVAQAVNAMAFRLRPGVAGEDWLDSVGNVAERAGQLALVTQGGHMVAEDPSRRYAWLKTGQLFFHVEGDRVILSSTLQGLVVAGPAAAAGRGDTGDALLELHPQVWAAGRVKAVAEQLAGFLEFIRRGTDRHQLPEGTPGMLATARALHYLRPFLGTETTRIALQVDPGGARLQLTTPAAGAAEPPLAPTLDRALGGEGAAALGALDCRRQIRGRQQLLIGAWREAGGPGVAELERLVDAEQAALDGTCSFAVRTAGEVWSEEASYPLRPGASGDSVIEALTAAIRSGGLPNLTGALEDLRTAKLLFSGEGGTLVVDRVLGDSGSPRTRHAAALHGGQVLRQRFAVREGRLLAVSGSRASERLAQLAKGSPQPLPPELEQVLATGAGKGGFLFLDLAALWRPFLKAAQVLGGPLAGVAARNPTLLKERRPVVITVEAGAGVDATARLPPRTFFYLLSVAALLFSGS